MIGEGRQRYVDQARTDTILAATASKPQDGRLRRRLERDGLRPDLHAYTVAGVGPGGVDLPTGAGD